MSDAAERLISEGRRAESEGRVHEACQLYREAVAAAPRYAKAHLNLGVALEALGDIDGAMRCHESALGCDPADPYANYNLGRLHYARGALARAEQLLGQALAGREDFPEARIVLAYVHDAAGNVAAAAAVLEEALRRRPEDGAALRSYAMALARLARWPQAETTLRRMLAADASLADADYWLALGHRFAHASRLEHAEDCYRRAAALEPGNADAHFNLGQVLKDLGRGGEALECYRAALALRADFAEARWSMALCRIPAVRDANDDLARIRSEIAAELASLEHWFDERRAAAGSGAVGVDQPFWLAYQEENNRELLSRYGRLCARLMARWQDEQGLRAAARRAPGPMRVGIVSQYFRDHSVWNAIVKGWFGELDRSRFALMAFCLGQEEDAETRYARARAMRFEQGARGLRQWVEAVLAAQPDVLIYPEIGMDPTALKLAALRLAPVQAVTWGHPETSGLPTMDFYLSAELLEPPAAQANYSERLVLLPQLGCFIQPSRPEPAIVDFASWSIDARTPLLLTAATPFKYAPEHDWVFPEIARRLGRCRIVFFTHWTRALSEKLRARLAHAFRRAGLDIERYAAFIPWQERPSFHQFLKRADVFLDTIGFSGFNTAVRAVEQGLPIVTREGRFMRGRLASAILKRMGLAELIARSEEDYVALAVRLCRDRAYGEELRSRIAASRHLLFEDRAPIHALEAFLADEFRPG